MSVSSAPGSFDVFRHRHPSESIRIVVTRPTLSTQSSRGASISRKFLFLGIASCLNGIATILTQMAENHIELCALTYITGFWYLGNGAGGVAVGLARGLQPSRSLLVVSLVLSVVNVALSMGWILAFNVHVAIWTKAAEKQPKLPLPNILVAHLLVSCLGVILGTLMVLVCLNLIREAGRYKTYDQPCSGPSSRVDGTDFDARYADV